MAWQKLFSTTSKRKFLAVFAGGTLLVAATLWAPLAVQIACLGVLLVLILALLVSGQAALSSADDPHYLEAPLALAKDEPVFECYRGMTEALSKISANKDSIYRELALERAAHLTHQLTQVGEDRIEFTGTETWRMVYERLLRSPGLHLYRSIAYVRTANYWQDEPGRRSMEVNFEMINTGTPHIERILIFPEHLWPTGERFPIEPLCRWVEQQHNHGVWTELVRQNDLSSEQDLVVDLGIYGNRAVGVQELDEQGRTVRFTLSFDFADVLAAEQRWERLQVYATSFRKLLDRRAPDA